MPSPTTFTNAGPTSEMVTIVKAKRNLKEIFEMRISCKTSLGVFAIAGTILAAGPAAAATCSYHAVDAFGSLTRPIITGWAAAAKKKTACKWAKNHCLRKLNKWRKKNPGDALVCVRD